MANPLNQYSPIQSALALLQPTISYAQKRADADRNLALQSAMTQQSQQQVEMAKQQALLQQQAQAQLFNVPFLPKDHERWQLHLDQLKKTIRNRVENDFGGDHETYAKTMLDQDIQNFALEAQRSPLYANALQRRSNFVQAQKDAESGKIFRSVQYKLTNGQTKVAPWEQAYLDFSNGDTEELPYQGAFKVDGKWRKHFDDVYSPRVDKLGKFRPDQATPQEIAAALTATEGLTAQDAMEYLQRTGPMLAPVYYKHDAVNPFEAERTKQGWANIALSKERNQIARDRNAIAKNASGQGAVSDWNITMSQPNIRTVDRFGNPGAVPVSVYDGDMKPLSPQQAGFSSLVGFDGGLIRDKLLSMLPGVRPNKDKATGQTVFNTNSLGKVHVVVPNQAGGLDARQADLSGLNVKVVSVGDVFVDDSKRSELEKTTGSHRVKVQAVVRLSSDEAKKARSGKLFQGAVPFRSDGLPGFNSDTPTGKGAAVFVGEVDGVKYYDVPVLIDHKLTAAQYQQINQRNPIFNKSGQIGATESLYDGGTGGGLYDNDD
ncbi:hypothetical protein [Spirosoma jeollabukense]